jgi:hypothetical protein
LADRDPSSGNARVLALEPVSVLDRRNLPNAVRIGATTAPEPFGVPKLLDGAAFGPLERGESDARTTSRAEANRSFASRVCDGTPILKLAKVAVCCCCLCSTCSTACLTRPAACSSLDALLSFSLPVSSWLEAGLRFEPSLLSGGAKGGAEAGATTDSADELLDSLAGIGGGQTMQNGKVAGSGWALDAHGHVACGQRIKQDAVGHQEDSSSPVH